MRRLLGGLKTAGRLKLRKPDTHSLDMPPLEEYFAARTGGAPWLLQRDAASL